MELGRFSNRVFLAPLRLPWLTTMSPCGNVLPLRWDISGQHQIPFLPACSHGGDYCFWLLLALKGIQRAQLLQAESRDRKPLPASPVCGYSAPSLHALAQEWPESKTRGKFFPPRLKALNEFQPAGPIETASRQMSTLAQRGLND